MGQEKMLATGLGLLRGSAMRILHLLHGIHFGGAEKIVIEIVRLAPQFGIDPWVACLARGRTYEQLRSLTSQVHLIPMRSKLDLWVVRDIMRIVKTREIDVVHTYSVRTNLLGRLCGLATGCPVVSTIQAPYVRDTNQSLRLKRLNGFVEACTRQFTTCFTTVNQRLARELVASGVPAERVRTIYNGVDVSPDGQAELPDDQPLPAVDPTSQAVGMVAAFRPRKGAEDLIRAIPLVLRVCSRTHFFFVGGGEFVSGRDYLGELRGLAHELGVGSYATFMGFSENPRPLINRMDIIALPSLFGEGCPVTSLEAMALQKPIVATRTEGNDEVVIDGQTGLLVPPRDHEALAEAIISLLNDPTKRAEMGRRGFERVKGHFTLEQMMQGYGQLYAELAQPKRQGSGRLRNSY